MLGEILRKWFGLEPVRCEVCEVLRTQLDESNRERKELLTRVLNPTQSEPLSVKEEEPQPIRPQVIPWKVRQQMLESEDRKQAQLMRDKKKEIEELEKELGIDHSKEPLVVRLPDRETEESNAS